MGLSCNSLFISLLYNKALYEYIIIFLLLVDILFLLFASMNSSAKNVLVHISVAHVEEFLYGIYAWERHGQSIGHAYLKLYFIIANFSQGGWISFHSTNNEQEIILLLIILAKVHYNHI